MVDWHKLKEGTKALLYYLVTLPKEFLKDWWKKFKKGASDAQRPIILSRVTIAAFVISAFTRQTFYMWVFFALTIWAYLIHIIRSGEHRRKYKKWKKEKYINRAKQQNDDED